MLLALAGCYEMHLRDGETGGPSPDAGTAHDARAATPECTPITTWIIGPDSDGVTSTLLLGEAPGDIVSCGGTDLKVVELVRGGPPAPWGVEHDITPAYTLWILDPSDPSPDKPCGSCLRRLERPRVITLPADMDRAMLGFPRSSWSSGVMGGPTLRWFHGR